VKSTDAMTDDEGQHTVRGRSNCRILVCRMQ